MEYCQGIEVGRKERWEYSLFLLPSTSWAVLPAAAISTAPAQQPLVQAPAFPWARVTPFPPLPLQVKFQSSFLLLVVAAAINNPYYLPETTHTSVNNHFIKKPFKNPS